MSAIDKNSAYIFWKDKCTFFCEIYVIIMIVDLLLCLPVVYRSVRIQFPVCAGKRGFSVTCNLTCDGEPTGLPAHSVQSNTYKYIFSFYYTNKQKWLVSHNRLDILYSPMIDIVYLYMLYLSL